MGQAFARMIVYVANITGLLFIPTRTLIPFEVQENEEDTHEEPHLVPPPEDPQVFASPLLKSTYGLPGIRLAEE
ncbi:hypothetical protein RhiJN_27477 [Ceratobasidium sp. AG-Ba]|nr:hypothetical protein RhiJN_13414 [Ceratobasidium sp. AG-Ba]QRV99458.1 hypothetical protein RhiJN_27477 [Ceratobasidium sp. AG-Ba]